MCTLMPPIKKGAFQVTAQNRLILSRQTGDGLQSLPQLREVRRDEGQYGAGSPVVTMECQGGGGRLRTVIKGRASSTVTMDIDEPRGKPSLSAVDHFGCVQPGEAAPGAT